MAIDLTKRLSSARTRRGLTQEDVAKRAGIPQSRAWDIETAPRSATYEEIDRYIAAIGATWPEIYAETDEPAGGYDFDLAAFGKVLRYARQQVGKDQTQAAAEVGVGSGVWSRYESGETFPGVDRLGRVLAAVELSPLRVMRHLYRGSAADWMRDAVSVMAVPEIAPLPPPRAVEVDAEAPCPPPVAIPPGAPAWAERFLAAIERDGRIAAAAAEAGITRAAAAKARGKHEWLSLAWDRALARHEWHRRQKAPGTMRRMRVAGKAKRQAPPEPPE